MKFIFAICCLALCACAVQTEPESNVEDMQQADQSDPNAVGIPPGCLIRYFKYDTTHRDPIMFCEWRNPQGTDTPDPAPYLKYTKEPARRQ